MMVKGNLSPHDTTEALQQVWEKLKLHINEEICKKVKNQVQNLITISHTCEEGEHTSELLFSIYW